MIFVNTLISGQSFEGGEIFSWGKWNIRQRDCMVGNKEAGEGTESTIIVWLGGSSKVFKRAFWASIVRLSASWIKTILYFWWKGFRLIFFLSSLISLMPMLFSSSGLMRIKSGLPGVRLSKVFWGKYFALSADRFRRCEILWLFPLRIIEWNICWHFIKINW